MDRRRSTRRFRDWITRTAHCYGWKSHGTRCDIAARDDKPTLRDAQRVIDKDGAVSHDSMRAGLAAELRNATFSNLVKNMRP